MADSSLPTTSPSTSVQPPTTPSNRPDPTPNDPSVEPHPSRSSTPIKIALIALFALLLGGAAFLLVWPRLSQAPATVSPTSTTNGINIPPLGETPSTTIPEITPPTTTVPTTIPSTDGPTTLDRGNTDVWFMGDEKIVRDPKTGQRWSVKAVEFGDSRCPADVVCVWAGERTVTLDVKNLTTGTVERIILGTTRGRQGTAHSLIFNLIEIDDGKGGVYAELKVE